MYGGALVLCISVTIVTVASTGVVDYCGARMCGSTNNHTFCQYHGGPGPQCVGYISAEMSEDEKSRVVARLNRRRNEVAAGMLLGMPSAGNMLKMHWVEELAREAQLWADQCIPPSMPEQHDACRDLYSVPVGQCVASVVGEAPGLRVESMVDIWYMQSMFYKGNVTVYVPPNTDSSYYGDFAQIMLAKSYMVGCGRSRFMITAQDRLRTVERLVCNIAPTGPRNGHSMWSPSPPGSMCPPHSSQDSSYANLCSINNDTLVLSNIHPSMTHEEHVLMYSVLYLEANDNSSSPGTFDQLYLTRLAAVALNNTNVSKSFYNTLSDKDIIEIIELENEKNKTKNISYIQVEDTQNTTKVTTTVKAKSNVRKIISLIGRPKSYNMEELTDIEYNTENYATAEDPLDEHEMYSEYNFVETAEEITMAQTYKIDIPTTSTISTSSKPETPSNLITSSNPITSRKSETSSKPVTSSKSKTSNKTKTTLTNTPKLSSRVINLFDMPYEIASDKNIIEPKKNIADNNKTVKVKVNKEDITGLLRKLYQNSSLLYEEPSNSMNVKDKVEVDSQVYNNETQLREVGNESKPDADNLDEYLQDPETVRELQEALENMERQMEPTERQMKVRRELRNSLPTEGDPVPVEAPPEDEQSESELRAAFGRNRTLSNPLYGMVMKYMPYMKNYGDRSIPPGAMNVASRTCSSFVLVLLLCL